MRRGTNAHDVHLQRAWENCRRGMDAVRSATKDRELVLSWIDEKNRVFNSPFLVKWRLIVSEELPELVSELRQTASFFDLPEDRQDEWCRLVQSHPFAAIISRAGT
jgi:hypothetical protein